MNNTRTSRVGPVIAVCLAIAGCSPAGAAPAGGRSAEPTGSLAAPSSAAVAITEPPITLRLAIADGPDAPVLKQAAALVQRVAATSGGKVTIDSTENAGGSAFEQGVLEKVTSGSFDLAIIGSRAFDLVGESSMTALQTPFLIDDEAVARAIAEGPIGRDALAGLRSVVGLTLWPEDLRHIVSIGTCRRDLTMPSAMKGTTFLVQPSAVLHDVLDTLGAVRYPTLEADRNIDAGTCALQGMEAGLDHLYSIPMRSHPVAVADVVLYTKFDVVVANRDAFSRLSDAQRDALGAAVADVQRQALAAQPMDVDLAMPFCDGGGSVVRAGAAAEAAWRAGVAPVVTKLERDAETKSRIAAIRALAASTKPTPDLPTCESTLVEEPQPSQDLTGYVGTTFPNGTFRRKLIPAELIAAGVPEAMARGNEQVLTYVFDSGRFTFSWDALNDTGSCTGTYVSVDNRYIELTPDSQYSECGLGPRHMWREVPGGISLLTLPNGSWNADDHEMLDYFPWTRIR